MRPGPSSRRLAARLLDDAACQWLRGWLVEARAAHSARSGDRGKRKLERELEGIAKRAHELAELLRSGASAPLLEHRLYVSSDFRADMLDDLQGVARQALEQSRKHRAQQPIAGAADLYLHLLYRSGSRIPPKTGNEVLSAPEVNQFQKIVTGAGVKKFETEAARRALTLALERFDRHATPDILLPLLRAGL